MLIYHNYLNNNKLIECKTINKINYYNNVIIIMKNKIKNK